MDKLPTPEGILEKVLTERVQLRNMPDKVKPAFVKVMCRPEDDGKNDFVEAMKEYAKLVVQYTLEQAAENVDLHFKEKRNSKGKPKNIGSWYEDENGFVKIDKQSILSLEGEIIKDLNL